MSLVCPRCSRTLDFSGDRPSFCAYCGQPLGPNSSPELQTVDSPNSPGLGRLAQAGSADTVAFVGSGPMRSDAVPERVAGYRLIRPLGSGGMGTVYEAEDSQHGRKVALKLIAPGQLDSADAVERFRQEGRLASTIAHPRCVFVLGADEEAGRPYILMELMPGSTLQALVDERGPLPPEEAVAKILDVIEGLAEAHQLGVLHRDVKPSNCFLDDDGRVKVGDFGLSKSLAGDSHLTRTGAFIGTPLYSSPEQIRGEPVDVRTDVYSVSATLYFLLTGKPPHQASDAAGTLAKIVADPVPPLRSIDPTISASLDRVVLHGLERQKDRRWRNMDDLRVALLPFAPGQRLMGSVGLRSAAFLLDSFLIALLPFLHFEFVVVLVDGRPDARPTASLALGLGLDAVLWIGIFGAMEGLTGFSPAKWMLRLQVRRHEGVGEAGWGRMALRTGMLYLLLALPAEIWLIAEYVSSHPWLAVPGEILLWSLGAIVMASTMRSTNGYRGLHEIVSKTRVVRLSERPKRRAPRIRREVRPFRNPMKRPVGVYETVGPFRVGGAVRWEPDRRVLLAEDPTLKRQVWLVLRPKGSAPPPAARRDLSRPTRARWLNGGDDAAGRWDAYVAPTGCPLVDLAGIDGLPWSDVRPILEDLSLELAASCAEGTLPGRLSVEQVWVEPDGRVLFVDALASGQAANDESPDARALRLQHQVAAVALEGGRRRVDDGQTPAQAVAPRYALDYLSRLVGGPQPFRDTQEAALTFQTLADRPTEVRRLPRFVRLLVVAALCGLGLLILFGFPFFESYAISDELQQQPGASVPVLRQGFAKTASIVLTIFPLAWIVWSFGTRGGITLSHLGLALVDRRGRPPARWRCALRAFVSWAPAAALVIAAVWSYAGDPSRLWPFGVLYGLGIAWLLLDATVALITPTRSLHDRLAGTYLVPR